VLRCFEMCNLSPDKRMEWIINSFVLRRINGELYAHYPFESGADSSQPTWAELFTGTILHSQFRDSAANPDLMNVLWKGFSNDRERVERQLGADAFAFVRANRPRLSKPKVARQLSSAQEPGQSDEGQSRTEEMSAQDEEDRVSFDLLVSTVRNCAIADVGIRPSTQTQTQRDAQIRRLMLEKDRIMFPRKPGGRVRKRPFRRPMPDVDDISQGLQDELNNIDGWDEEYNTS